MKVLQETIDNILIENNLPAGSFTVEDIYEFSAADRRLFLKHGTINDNIINDRTFQNVRINFDEQLIDETEDVIPVEASDIREGFIDYNDLTNSTSLIANTWTDIPNDGLGAFTNKKYRPQGIVDLLDVNTGYVDTTTLQLGETILLRNDYSINPDTNNALLKLRYVLGNGAGEYTLEKTIGRLDSGSGVFYRFSLEPDLIYMGDENTRLNPIKIQINLSTTGTLINAGTVIQLI